MSDQSQHAVRMRLDKWLWVARFFKTRSLAKQAIEKGQVLVDGQRPKGSREIAAGDVLQVQQGFDRKTVTVLALAEQRGHASVAQALYHEDEASIRLREEKAAQRRAQQLSAPVSDHRPNKRERRQWQALSDLLNE
jgi:ribosome-associated heat shock protein Hsp15